MEQTRGLFCMCESGEAHVNHNTNVTSGEGLLCSKRIAQASVKVAAVNQNCVNYEAMNGCKNLKIR